MDKMLYTLQLSNINCTNCENKIKTALAEKVTKGLLKTTVVILQEKVNVVVESEQVLQKVIQVLAQTGYKLIGEPIFVEGSDENIRNATFLYNINSQSEQLQNILRETPGIVQLNRVHIRQSIKLRVTYDCRIIKGREVADIIRERDPQFKTINERVESFKNTKGKKGEGASLSKTALLCSFFILFDMILPFTGQWYMQMSSFPTALGPYSFSVLLNLSVTLFTLNKYAKPIIKRSFEHYFTMGGMDMETLISLGCSSAFFLFVFFLVKYSLDFFRGEFQPDPSIMQINDALASSAIIVLVVTIGKHFENKVKNKIEEISNSIFPQSVLFTDMNVNWVKLKNRKLKIQEKVSYDVSLLEVDDIFEITQGKRLLVDAIVLSGEFDAIESAIDGNDETKKLAKGSKIESGSIIVGASEDSLLQVENVFEKSILVEIGTHIKLRRNQEQNSQSGIQAVCKTISKYFVKTVILISLVVMASWFFLLSFDFVEVPGCNFCWIVERGIGVLVASCPCALGLAVPSVVAIVLNIAIKNGILIRNSGVLEKMKKCKIISFDKTGTLFTRINKIEQYYVFGQTYPQNLLWEMIALIEKPIKHPIAEILYKQAYNFSKVEGTNFSVFISQPPVVNKSGLSAEISLKATKEEMKVLLGNRKLFQERGINIPYYEKNSSGATQLFLALNNEIHLVLIMNTHSNLRPEAVEVIQLLMKEKKEVHILSGDSRESVEKLGRKLKIPAQNLHSEHSSHMKEEWIKKVQNDLENDNGIGVIMVGDGLNDIPCLQQASIGISINAKSQLNINASDVIMLSENLFKLLSLVKLLQKGNKFININLFWAFIYNLTIMPIVAGLFYGFNFTISPIWSSVAMSCSSIIVVGFSHMLSFYEYDEEKKFMSRNIKKSKSERMVTHEDSARTQIKENYSKFNEQINLDQ